MLSSHGLPGFLAYGAYVGEILAPVLIIVGVYTRLGGLLIAINMVVAILLAHSGQIGSLTNNGGWALELQGMFLFTGLAIAFMGAGRFSLAGNGGRWN
jgi:putative oxidoreductase